jgi:hypothetical protein
MFESVGEYAKNYEEFMRRKGVKRTSSALAAVGMLLLAASFAWTEPTLSLLYLVIGAWAAVTFVSGRAREFTDDNRAVIFIALLALIVAVFVYVGASRGVL